MADSQSLTKLHWRRVMKRAMPRIGRDRFSQIPAGIYASIAGRCEDQARLDAIAFLFMMLPIQWDTAFRDFGRIEAGATDMAAALPTTRTLLSSVHRESWVRFD
jgi:hypothetical protein